MHGVIIRCQFSPPDRSFRFYCYCSCLAGCLSLSWLTVLVELLPLPGATIRLGSGAEFRLGFSCTEPFDPGTLVAAFAPATLARYSASGRASPVSTLGAA